MGKKEKKIKNLSHSERHKLKKSLSLKKDKLEKIISNKRYQEFEKIIFPFIFYDDIKKILSHKDWESQEIKYYYDYMMVLKKESDIEKFETQKNRGYTIDQIKRIKNLSKEKKGKAFDRSGKVTDKVKIFQGGSPGLGKGKS